MKKKSLLTMISSMTLCTLFASLMSISFFNHNEAKESKAVSSANPGVFKMITDLSEIGEGNEVIIAADTINGRNAISNYDEGAMGLNYHTIGYDVSYYDDEGYLVAKETQSEIFEVYKDEDDAMAFLGTTQEEGNLLKFKYFALDDDYGNIVAKPMNEKDYNCSWIFVARGDGKFLIQNKQREYKYLTYSNSVFKCNNEVNAIDFKIYKKISCEDVTIKTQPRHLTYYKGEEKDLKGLVLKYNLKNGESFSVNYEDATQIIGISWSNNNEIYCYAYDGTIGGGYKSFSISITSIDNPNYVYNKVDSTSYGDFRGSYLFVYDKGDGTGYVFDNTLSNLNQRINYYIVNISNNQISGLNSYYEQHLMGVRRYTPISTDRYYISMGYSSSYVAGDSYDNIKTTMYPDQINRVKLFDNNRTVTISRNLDPAYFVYNENEDRFMFTDASGHHDVSLFKLATTSTVTQELDSYRQEFALQTAVCDSTGVDKNITSTIWDGLRDSFNALSYDAQGYLANLTYEHGKETKDSLKDIVDRYDYIISKYPEFEDFMSRKVANTYEDYYPSNGNSVKMISSNKVNGIVVGVIALSSSSLIALVVFLNLKKKKEQ